MTTSRKNASQPEPAGFISLRTVVILVLAAIASMGSVAAVLTVSPDLDSYLSLLVGGSTGLLVMIGACVSLHALIERDR